MSESPPSPGGYTLKAETGRLYITPYGFWTRAQDFLDAGVLLSEKKGRFAFVAAHLSCSAIEITLKAYLLAKGATKPEVKKLGHNLQGALLESFARGIENLVELMESERALLLRVNNDYVDRNFAYFDIDSAVTRPMDPELELLPTVARKVLDAVKQTCLDATGG